MSDPDWLSARPLIGMVHLLPLPGSPQHRDWNGVCERAMSDAAKLVDAGFVELMIENFGDIPFYPKRVPAEVVACMAVIGREIRGSFPNIRCGVNVLRNDGLSALAVAAACGAEFIRVNVLTGARLTDQGIVSGVAHDLLRLRRKLGADVRILADVDVKHSSPLGTSTLADDVRDLTERGLADAVIVSGSGTGQATAISDVQEAKDHCNVPVLIGSGTTLVNIRQLSAAADGIIIGSAIKENGQPRSPVNAIRAAAFVEAWADNASRGN